MIRILLTAALASLAFAATAQSVDTNAQPPSGDTATQGVGFTTQPTVEDPVRDDATTRDVRDHNCLRETGSLITTAKNQQTLRDARRNDTPNVTVKCADYGRAYTQDDIHRTGALDVGEALRQLDPAIH